MTEPSNNKLNYWGHHRLGLWEKGRAGKVMQAAHAHRIVFMGVNFSRL